MSKKVHPEIFRVGQIKTWKSRWFSKKKYQENLKQDINLRDFLMKKLSKTGIDRVEIERTVNLINVIIYTVRPGLIIGRGGDSVEKLKEEIKGLLQKENFHPAGDRPKAEKNKIEIRVQIEQVAHPEAHANIVAQNIAEQLEKRIHFRRVIKQAIDKIMQTKGVLGAKIMISGRLGGAEIARKESLAKGRLPLQTLRADINYAQVVAYTTYGTVGVKVWIYKGDIFK